MSCNEPSHVSIAITAARDNGISPSAQNLSSQQINVQNLLTPTPTLLRPFYDLNQRKLPNIWGLVQS